MIRNLHRRLVLQTALAAITCGFPGAAKARTPRKAASSREAATIARLARLAAVRNWAYQLRVIDFDAVALAAIDLVVLEHSYSTNHKYVRDFAPDAIARARMQPNGRPRIALAYMSIGEAERYRFYWQPAWHEPATAPSWLGALNRQWDGNYAVKYWDPAWQALMFGGPDAFLDRLIAQGFDGVYLDRADAFQDWAKTNPRAERDMRAFLARLIAYARAKAPDFLIVMQNAEELLADPIIRFGIDAIAKEDLFFGIDGDGRPNDPAGVRTAARQLAQSKSAGRRVFVVEYLDDARKAASARARAIALGFLPHVTDRSLHLLLADEPGGAIGPLPPATTPPPATAPSALRPPAEPTVKTPDR